MSQNKRSISVTVQVAISNQYSSGSESDFARDRLAIVHSADAQTFTRLLPIITVIRSLMVVIFIILFIMDSKQKNTIYKAKKKEFGNTKLIKAMNIVATLPLKNR